MRAARVSSLVGPSEIEVAEIEEPIASKSQVLIEVHKAGVTFPDVLLTLGLYQEKPPLPFILGCEVAGIVLEPSVGSTLRVGDRVCAYTRLGGFAEVVAVDTDWVFRVPHDVTLAAAATLPRNYLTVLFALAKRGQLQVGERVLVHGAGGGIGSAAVQLACSLGARVIGVASSTAKREVAFAAGAEDVVAVEGFRNAVRAITDGRGVDVVVDPVGGERFTNSLRSLAPEGRLLVVGFTAGEIPTVRVNRLLMTNTSVVGVGWDPFFRSHVELLAEDWHHLVTLFASGKLQPIFGNTYPLAEASRALSEFDERGATGQILLSVR